MEQTQESRGVDARVIAKAMQKQRDDDSNFAKYQIDSSEVLEEIDHFLKGEKKDYTTGKWTSINKDGSPLMNDSGRLAFMFLIQAHINKVIHLSKLHINDIMRLMTELNQSIILTLCFHGENWDVEVAYYDFIVDAIDHLVFGMCMSAEGGGMRIHLGTIQKLIERIGIHTEGKKKETQLGGG